MQIWALIACWLATLNVFISATSQGELLLRASSHVRSTRVIMCTMLCRAFTAAGPTAAAGHTPQPAAAGAWPGMSRSMCIARLRLSAMTCNARSGLRHMQCCLYRLVTNLTPWSGPSTALLTRRRQHRSPCQGAVGCNLLGCSALQLAAIGSEDAHHTPNAYNQAMASTPQDCMCIEQQQHANMRRSASCTLFQLQHCSLSKLGSTAALPCLERLKCCS